MARVLRRVVVDAAPLIALLRDEPNVDRILEAIGEAGASVSTVTLAEVADVLERVHGWPSGAVTGAVTGVLGVAVAFVAPTPELATRAGAIRARHYRRRENAISLGDCFVLATAAHGETLVTSDRALARTARAEGIDVALVPSAHG
jgi:predicted nucleic acid-binding protein